MMCLRWFDQGYEQIMLHDMIHAIFTSNITKALKITTIGKTLAKLRPRTTNWHQEQGLNLQESTKVKPEIQTSSYRRVKIESHGPSGPVQDHSWKKEYDLT